MRELDFLLGEEDFLAQMEGPLAQFREEHYKEGMVTGVNNHMIHYVYLKREDAKAAVVISHGFCEFIRKYDELLYYFYEMGYNVYMLEHLGHGFSHRLVDEVDKVHVTNFADYVEDFRIFTELVKEQNEGMPLLLFAHSMGGNIGALFLEQHPGYYKAAVLSSPMLEVATGKYPAWTAYVVTALATLTGKGTNYAPGKHGFDHVNIFPASSMLSEARYEYAFRLREQVPEYRTYGATMTWVLASLRAASKSRRDAKKVQTPVLLCQAGLDKMVGANGQNIFAERSKNTRLVCFAAAKHEIFNSLQPEREAFWKEVFTFYEEQCE